MLGFASTCVASWEGILTYATTYPWPSCFPYADNGRYLGFVLTDGGTALLFWGFLACATGQTLVYASLAEMASM
jgi:hypothetical protein